MAPSCLTKCCNKEEETASVEETNVEGGRTEGGTGRAVWSSPTEFLLTCIGYSVGLGNVWRFPYLCYKSGGGAFLIPYVIMMILIGMPLLFMEYGFGQYFGVGGLTIFKKVCPMLQGVGVGYMVLNGLVCIYYNVIIAISLYYLFASFTSSLPWASCDNWWNTPNCGDPVHINMTANGTLAENGTFANVSSVLNTTVSPLTSLMGNASLAKSSSSEEYFKFALMDMHDEHSVENVGQIRWHLCLCLLLAWILVVIFVSRGIQSTGKVAYFTATFPYLMLTVLVVRGVTLPGATNGILYFVTPVWHRLRDPSVWFGAATQLFYSTNLAWGGMITMSSYNTFSHNCYRDAVMINLVSFFTSLYAGFAVFSIIGYMAHEQNLEIDHVIDSGPGLAFIVYPRALSLMPLAPMWSALFFFMLFLLGIGSQMVQVETLMTGIVDKYQHLKRTKWTRLLTVICVCSCGLMLGLPCTTQGGMYVLQLMDHYSATFGCLVIAIVECIAINWCYGNDRFAANIKEMLGHIPKTWWRICWKYISPLLILGILVFSFVDYKAASYGDYRYPAWADTIGWCMSMASILPIFIVAGVSLYRAKGDTLLEKYQYAIKPNLEKNPGEVTTIEEKFLTPPKQNNPEDGDKLEPINESEAQKRALMDSKV